jgi:site-specific recombinase XerD
LAVAAHLARYKGETRVHTASDLNSYLRWCLERSLNPFEAGRVHVELYLRWLQEVRQLKPSTVSRRLSVLATFYRTCVIDGVLEHSPAEYVRRPKVPPAHDDAAGSGVAWMGDGQAVLSQQRLTV